MKNISSRDNPHIRRIRRWAEQAKARREDGILLLEGIHLLDAFLETGGQMREIMVSETAISSQGEISAWLATHHTLPAFCLADRLFKDIAQTETPAGIIGIAHRPGTGSEISLPSATEDAVLLDGVQDPGNLGTLLRTAAAAGVGQVLLSAACADPYSPKSLRAGQGAQFSTRIYEHADLPAFLACYTGQKIVTRLDAAVPLHELVLTAPVAFVFGAEGQGVSPQVAAAADTGVCIPMPGKIESLNVSAAAAICLFEQVRQRLLKKQ